MGRLDAFDAKDSTCRQRWIAPSFTTPTIPTHDEEEETTAAPQWSADLMKSLQVMTWRRWTFVIIHMMMTEQRSDIKVEEVILATGPASVPSSLRRRGHSARPMQRRPRMVSQQLFNPRSSLWWTWYITTISAASGRWIERMKQYNSFELVAAHLILTNFPPQPGQIRMSYHTIWRIPTGPGNPSPQDECGCWSEAADADRNWWIVPSLDMNNLSVTIPNNDWRSYMSLDQGPR